MSELDDNLPAVAEDGVPVSDDFVEPPREVYERVDLAEEQRRFDEDAIAEDDFVLGEAAAAPPDHEGCTGSYCPVCGGEGIDVFPPVLPEPEPEGEAVEEVWTWSEAERYLEVTAPWWRLVGHLPPPTTFAFNEAGWCRSDLNKWIAKFGPEFEDEGVDV